jgi:hypothetical protein
MIRALCIGGAEYLRRAARLGPVARFRSARRRTEAQDTRREGDDRAHCLNADDPATFPTPASSPGHSAGVGSFEAIATARAKEQIAKRDYDQARRKHRATNRLFKKWVRAKAELAALGG